MSDKAKSSEMEHALRYHIRKHFDEDPARYTKLSQRLDEILEDLRGRWDQLALALGDLVVEASVTTSDDKRHLDPAVARFSGMLESELADDAVVSEERRLNLESVSGELVSRLRKELRRVGYWQNAHAQSQTRRWVFTFLDGHDLFELSELAGIADRVMDLARANHTLLMEGQS